mgnify:CR=1 FL=1
MFCEYFELNANGKNLYESSLKRKEKELIKRIIKNEVDSYMRKTVDELLKDKEFLNYVYGSQRGNNLLLITFFAQKKIEEKGFMDELEKNYGIYLDVDNFIKEMRQKLDEVKSYAQLFEYIGSEFGKNKTNEELIKEAFEKLADFFIDKGVYCNFVCRIIRNRVTSAF